MERRTFLIGAGLLRASAQNAAVRLALFGCGGRGTGVAQGFAQNTQARIAAVGDLFPDAAERAQQRLKAPLKFTGPQALDELLASKEIDAVYIATPPYFHPEHLAKAVASGKHVYCEKPVAVDVPGCKRVQEIGRQAQGKQSLAVGFQLRHAPPYVELVQQVRSGSLGTLVCGLSHYYAGHIGRPEWPKASPAERRLRNWIWDRVISGDIIVEQNIHLIDVNNWVLGGHPLQAQAAGGRNGRKDGGDCYSHYNVNYKYAGGVDVTLTSTQFIEGEWDVAMRYFGTAGNAEMHYDAPVRITGKNAWSAPGVAPAAGNQGAAAAAGAFKGAIEDADMLKQRSFIDSITTGKFLNEAQQGAESTLSAILGRTAAYTGRTVTWEELLQSTEKYDAKLDVARFG